MSRNLSKSAPLDATMNSLFHTRSQSSSVGSLKTVDEDIEGDKGTGVAAKAQDPKPIRWLPRPQLQSQYIYAKPLTTLDSILDEDLEDLPSNATCGHFEVSKECEPICKAAATRQKAASLCRSQALPRTSSMSLTSLASTLVDNSVVHSSTTAAAGSPSGDRYGWEEEHGSRRSLDSEASEETVTELRPTMSYPLSDCKPKKGLLWKVLNMNGRG